LITFVLPFPPSVNTYYRHLPNGRTLLSKKGRLFKAFGETLPEFEPFSAEDRLRVHLQLFPPTKRSFDIDNFAKATLDLLESAGVFPNDNQIDELYLERREVVKGGKAVVMIERLWTLPRTQ